MQFFAKGNRGNEVVDIQIKLSRLGYNLGPNGADGCFGDATEIAVKEFQRDRDLIVNGRVDEKTWKVLVEATYRLGDRLLYLRSPFYKGDDVRELQNYLNTLGFNTGQVDGIYGETTERAVREFQRNVGLQSDGIFGQSTLAAIQNLRHLLTDEVSCIFPDPHRDQPSALSIFQNKKIAIDLNLQDRLEGVWCAVGEIEISRDLGARLGNLLELLGARVFYLGEREASLLDGTIEMYIGFGLSSASDSKLCGSTVIYANSPGEVGVRSQILAISVQEEITRSLGSKDLGIRPSSLKLKANSEIPVAIVKPLFATNPRECLLLCEEIFRQKIAVAVFDGIKNYLQFL
ncbi:MAG: peptidoglycan-binding protein [Actinobacteria bacterium]|nr:peptidoglycan-binding protein [Actinomycetota bacterium]